MGHTFVVSEDGRQALEIYRSEAVDTIITDWVMPEWTAWNYAAEYGRSSVNDTRISFC